MTKAAQITEQVYSAFSSGDMQALAELLGETEWHEAAGMPYGGVWNGFDQIAQNVFGPIASQVEGFSAIPDEIVGLDEDRAVAFGVYRGDKGGVATPFCHLWTVRAGRVAKFVQYADSYLYRQQTGLL